MRRIVATLAIVSALTGAYLIGATSAPVLPACAMEDSPNCFWDAGTSGNGVGTSFVDIGGVAYYPEP